MLGSFQSLGNNLIGHNLNATASFAASVFVAGVPQPNVNLDLVGSISVGTSVIDPRLGSVTNNGGPTNTRALRVGSPAIDAGNNCVTFAGANPCGSTNTPPTQLTTDQRSTGFVRQFDGNADTVAVVDIGAFERQGGDPVDQVYTVNTNGDTSPNGCTAGNCTLREAIIAANSNPGEDAIVFDNSLIGQTIALQNGSGFGHLLITDSVTITGPNGCARNLTISGNNTSRVFQVTPATLGNDIQVRISGLTLSDGNGAENSLLGLPVAPGPGGAVLNTGGGSLFLDSVNVSGNRISLLGLVAINSLVGGGVATVGTDLERTRTYISRSLISNNSSGGGGGGVANVGTGLNILGATTVITNTTITGNGAGSLVDAAAGGGILNAAGTMYITNATVSHNRATLLGGGITNVIGVPPVGAVYTRNSIYARNTDLLGLDLLFPDTAGIFISLGNNMVGNNGILGLTVGLAANVTVGPLPSGPTVDIVGSIQIGFTTVNPNLGPLQNNGGCTDTRAVLTGSPAIDRANNCVVTGSCPTFNPFDPIFPWDQRGNTFTRIYDGDFDSVPVVDIGAYEAILAPTAANVSISGRVMDGSGRGVANAYVTATDLEGNTVMGRTNMFGYYRIEDVSVGMSYVVNVSTKRFSFQPQTVMVEDHLGGIDFTPEGTSKQ